MFPTRSLVSFVARSKFQRYFRYYRFRLLPCSLRRGPSTDY